MDKFIYDANILDCNRKKMLGVDSMKTEKIKELVESSKEIGEVTTGGGGKYDIEGLKALIQHHIKKEKKNFAYEISLLLQNFYSGNGKELEYKGWTMKQKFERAFKELGYTKDQYVVKGMDSKGEVWVNIKV